MKLAYILTAILLAALPNALADVCGTTVIVSEGDPIAYAIVPDGSYDYLWSGITGFPGYEADKDGNPLTVDPENIKREITLEAPPVDCVAHPTGEDYSITGALTSNVAGTAYATCTDSCTFTIHVDCVPCPTVDAKGTICIRDWADWTLDAGTGFEADDVFTWKVYNIDGTTPVQVGSDHVDTGDPTHTFEVGDFTAPTNDVPKICFRIDLTVVTNEGEKLLDCESVGKICLVFDPATYNSGEGITIV